MEYGKINESGGITYAVTKNGAVVVDGKLVWGKDISRHGYYPVVNVEEDGSPKLVDGVIYNYLGSVSKSELEESINNTEGLIKALERMLAANGATPEDREMASKRIAMRDKLGKIVQTEEGDGSAMNPYKWTAGKSVEAGMWYKTPGGYLWQAIKTGVPESETDAEYFEVVGA